MNFDRVVAIAVVITSAILPLACGDTSSSSDDDAGVGVDDSGTLSDAGNDVAISDAHVSDVQSDRDAATPVVLRQIAPLSTSHVTSTRPTLHWVLPSTVSTVTIDLCHDRSCTNPIESPITASGTSYRVATDLPAGVIFWRLRTSSTTTATWQFFVGAANDAGSSVDTSWGTTLDLNGDGLSDVAVGDNSALSGLGKTAIYLGQPTGTSEPATVLIGPHSGFGSAITSAGDVNGDGYSDLIVGAPSASSSAGGYAFIYIGGGSSLSASPSISLSGPVSTSTNGLPTYGAFGSAVAGIGDINGDGYGDVAIGDYYSSDGSTSFVDEMTGTVYVYLGTPHGPSTTPSFTLQAPGGSESQFGYQIVSAGDINGDGYGDFAVSAIGFSYNTGRVYIYEGGTGSLLTAPTAFIDPPGDPEFNHNIGFGSLLTSGSDLNGDGYADITISIGEGFANRTSIFLGGSSGLATIAAAQVTYPVLDDGQHTFVTSAGDVNGDGYADLLTSVSAGYSDGATINVFTGDPNTAISSTPLLTITRADSDAAAIDYEVTGAGDFNGDRLADLLVTAPVLSLGFLYAGSSSATVADPAQLVTDAGPSDDFGAAAFGTTN